MRKLYALLAGICFILASIKTIAQTPTADKANFTFTVDAPGNNVVFTNTTVISDAPGERHTIWSFGDGTSQRTGLHDGTQHHYSSAGTYTVCLRIYRFINNTNDSVLSAEECKTVVIESICQADFETVSVNTNPLRKYFIATPLHNQNKKPVYICWNFGDGKDTCIQYSVTQTEPYAVGHTYLNFGKYEVCVRIVYDGGCESRKCKDVVLENPSPDECGADFERVLPTVSNDVLYLTFKALPKHNHDKRPLRICWSFGDGTDTCIQYPNPNTASYSVNHHYKEPGTYQVCLKILYDGGCEAGSCKSIQLIRPDECSADFEKVSIISSVNSQRAYFIALPKHNNNKKPATICWTFGDGKDTCIKYEPGISSNYAVPHNYKEPGTYEVCVKILYDGGCEAKKCKTIVINHPDACSADFERVPLQPSNDPLRIYFKALPKHSNDKKPATICWTFGDGKDTCIKYEETFTGTYAVAHKYKEPGSYEVCVKILYYGGCESKSCKTIAIERPDECGADFERIQSTANVSLASYFRAIIKHNNDKKPERICWKFGDGIDTCIKYEPGFAGQYVTGHLYKQAGSYEVCVDILYAGGCEAKQCRIIKIGEADSCKADFETISVDANPLRKYFTAKPWHNQNKKPVYICWKFGDGRDTCIQYAVAQTAPYAVGHNYSNSGQYEVCVRIVYDGGCESKKCTVITIPPIGHDTCIVKLFEVAPSITSLVRGFYASPSSDTNKKPERICWSFGDGKDTCVMINDQSAGAVSQLFIRHAYPGPGVYRACVKILYSGGCIASDCIEVTIRSFSNVCGGYMVDSLADGKTVVFKGFSIHTTNDEPAGFWWSFGDGSTADGKEVKHTYSAAGIYEVCLTIKTRSGCETRICKKIRVPGNNEPTLHLTPNPVITTLHVEFLSTHTEQVNIKILNSSGIAIRSYVRNVTTGVNNWDIDLNNLLTGVYSFVLQSPNQLTSAIFFKTN